MYSGRVLDSTKVKQSFIKIFLEEFVMSILAAFMIDRHVEDLFSGLRLSFVRARGQGVAGCEIFHRLKLCLW